MVVTWSALGADAAVDSLRLWPEQLARDARDKQCRSGSGQALLDWASLPPDEEFGPGLVAFFRTSGRPENAARVRYLFDNGLQTPVGVELDLGRAVGEFASWLDVARPSWRVTLRSRR